MYINDNNGWGWRASKDRCRLSADRYPPVSPSTGMELRKAVRIVLYTHRPRGRYHHPQRRRRCCPLSEAMQPFYTTRGVSRVPLFLICGGAATTTL